MNEKDTMKNSRKTNVKSNTSDIEAKEKKEQQEQEKILAAKYLIELIRSVLEERKPQPKPEQISMKCLFLTAKKHNLACMAYDAAKQIAGEEDKEVMEAWQNYNRTCMIMSAVQGKEGERLLERFSDNQVRVLPLKGWIMRRFYPKPEYRQMTDLDFLIDEENRKAVKQIMTDQERYQFQHIENENTVDSYQKDPWMHVEIHNDMISYNKERYENIWERCEQKNAVYSMNWDDYYMFMLDHLEKHFTLAGCGIRFLLDVYIFLQAKGKELHRDKLKKEFRKRNQEAFFKQVEETANAWFGEAYHVGDTELEKVILLSGTFGTNLYIKEVQHCMSNVLPVEDLSKTYLEHSMVINNFVIKIGSQIKDSLCRVFGDGVQYEWRENDDKVMIPDVSIICNLRDRKNISFTGIPRFVMEVLSNATEEYDRHEKMNIYCKVGVSEYWIVDWRKKSVEIYLFDFEEDGTGYPYLYKTVTAQNKEELQLVMFPNLKITFEELFDLGEY